MFLSKIFNVGGLFGDKDSKSVAKSRLHFVLVQDRTGLTPEEMAKFKRELVEVIERYFQINEGGFDIQYKRDCDLTTLLINSPVVVRRKLSGKEAREVAKAESAQVAV